MLRLYQPPPPIVARDDDDRAGARDHQRRWRGSGASPQKRGGNGEREHGRSNHSEMTSRALLTWAECGCNHARDRFVARPKHQIQTPLALTQTILIAHRADSFISSVSLDRARSSRILTAATDERVTIAISFNDNSPAALSNSTSRSPERRRLILGPQHRASAGRLRAAGPTEVRRALANNLRHTLLFPGFSLVENLVQQSIDTCPPL
jgi:hypothetical protein